MTDFPEPLTPPDCDLRDFAFMPLEVERLRKSKAWLWAKREPSLGFYMVNLWASSWHEKPAASLEDDEDVLADAAMCEPKLWPRVREKALHGWVKCSDGRLYHPVVAEKANEAWQSKQKQRLRTQAATKARQSTMTVHNLKRGNGAFDDERHGQRYGPRDDERNDIASGERDVGRDDSRNGHRDVDVTFTKGQGRDGTVKEQTLSSSALRPARDTRGGFDAACCLLFGEDWKKQIASKAVEFQRQYAALRETFTDDQIARAAKSVADRGIWPGSLNYLRKVLDDMPRPEPEKPLTRDQWRFRAKAFFHGLPPILGDGGCEPGFWVTELGPNPSEPGCLCPPEVLAEFASARETP